MSNVDLPILEALAAEPSLSQRELAQRAGLSLTKAHFVLKRLMERGFVKVRNAAQSEHKLGYLYLLTPQGMEEKANLTYAFLQRTAAQYQQMVGRVENALEQRLHLYDGAKPVSVAIVGEGPLAQVVRDIVSLRGEIELVENVDEATLTIDVTGQRSSNTAAANLKTIRLV